MGFHLDSDANATTYNVGNMGQLFSHDNEEFYNDLVETYGPVSKLHGALGVGVCRSVHLVHADILWRRARPYMCMTPRLCTVSTSRIRTITGEVVWQTSMHDQRICVRVLKNVADCLQRSGNLTIGAGLLSTYGAKHKKQRKVIGPAFSTVHMRNLTPLFFEVIGRVSYSASARCIRSPWLTMKLSSRLRCISR